MNNSSNLYLPWSAEFSISNFEIDSEHEKILTLFNDLYTMHQSNADFHFLSEKFTQLIDAISLHFRNEEKILFAVLPCDSFKRHKALHKNLVHQVAEVFYEFDASKKIPTSFFSFFKIWFVADIIGADRDCLSGLK